MTEASQHLGDSERVAAPPVADRDIGRRAVHGVAWTYASFAGSKILIFAATVVLARLLIPTEFGQVGFVLLVISYMDTVGDLGISSALIYEREHPEEAADVAFIVSILAGAFWCAAAFLAAPIIAQFFHDPAVTPIMRAMAGAFVINALGNTHDAILRRDLEFKKRLLPDFAMAGTKGVLAIGLAFAGWGVWSLVWGQLLGSLAATIALWIIVPWRPGWKPTWRATRKMLGYGKHIVSVNVVSAIVHDADFVIVGRILGATALGLYSLAYRTPELLITTVIWVIGKVTFPVYSRLRHDADALANAFLVTLRYLSLVTLPAGLGLAFLGSAFMSTFYGPNWSAATLTMQALAIAGALRSLGSHTGDIYKATGRPHVLTKLGLLRAAVLIPAMIWGARFGIFGVAATQLLVTGASTLLNLVVAGRILKLPLLTLLAQFRSSVIASSLMLIVLAVGRLAMPEWPGPIVLVVEVALGGLTYLGAVMLVDGDAILQARRAFSRQERQA